MPEFMVLVGIGRSGRLVGISLSNCSPKHMEWLEAMTKQLKQIAKRQRLTQCERTI